MAQAPTRQQREIDDAILQQQFRRALSSFEGIILSQIDIKNKLGARLNYSIQAGIIILVGISVSISVLLFTLTSQITRISGVVDEMNNHFSSVSGEMHRIKEHMGSMERRVALLESVEARTALMDREMSMIRSDMERMRADVGGIDQHLTLVRNTVGNISGNMDLMNQEVQAMSADVGQISRPARTINRLLPFP